MKNSAFTVIFWNVWFFVQDGHHDDGSKLIIKLGELIDEFNPDVFGLNEVLVNRRDNSSKIIEFLQLQGYYCHFSLFSPVDDTWFVGSLLASKLKPTKVIDHTLGPDSQAARRGYKGYTVKAIEADILRGGVTVAVLVNYLCSLLPADWKTHIFQRRVYEHVVSNITNKNIIIGGDFNETKYMLPWLRLPSYLTRKTGSLTRPTWRLNGQKNYLGFANYDNLLYSETGQLRLQKFKVLDRHPSDHAPLLGIFTVD